jgi:hypothetical protein
MDWRFDMDKKKSQFIHAQKRLIKRHSILPSKNLFNEWVKSIQNGKAEFIDRQLNRLTRWLVEYDNKKIPVVYDKERKSIVTILENEMINLGKD